ncbi:MAG: segregation/condensation protein A [Actinomycetia bacterium]|nr:segregation/condensation protein A [Actinomycetes bacterium]
MPYSVHTEVFDGPFDLLLHLILREEVDLYEVQLSTIVDAYLRELDRMTEASDELNLDIATEFLLIAATLVELKTRRLLPSAQDIDLDDELMLWEERDLLLARLIECKTFKNAAATMRSIADDASLCFPRTAGPDERFHELTPDLLAGVVADDLRRAFVRAITPKPIAKVETDHIAPIRISVTDAVSELVDELPRLGKVSFRTLTESLVARLDIVVRFLAVLELYKAGMVELAQVRNFGDLEIEWTGTSDDDVSSGLSIEVDVYSG